MSTSLLYRAFGIRDYRCVRTKYKVGGCGVCDRSQGGDLSLRCLKHKGVRLLLGAKRLHLIPTGDHVIQPAWEFDLSVRASYSNP